MVTAHLLLGAVWLGAMSYSLGVVQPRLLTFFGAPLAAEEAATYVAAGARRKVVAFIAAIVVTGGVLVGLSLREAHPSRWWWAAVATKVLVTAIASALFWHVSWRMWPRRVFAASHEVASHQAAFRRVGACLVGLVGWAMVAGVALRFLR